MRGLIVECLLRWCSEQTTIEVRQSPPEDLKQKRVAEHKNGQRSTLFFRLLIFLPIAVNPHLHRVTRLVRAVSGREARFNERHPYHCKISTVV